MAESSQPTQQATQPFQDPRRLGKHLSDISDNDATDIVCILHPNSPAAFEAIKANLPKARAHILQNDDLQDIHQEDLLFQSELRRSRDLALRMSSTVKNPEDGFRFGRNPTLCDIVLTGNHHDKLISNTHFKIYVNSQGSLMLQDLSTNGTIVDDDHLRTKDRHGKQLNQPATRALKNGSIICIVGGPERAEIKFMVRIPNRGDNEDVYEEKLKKYLAARGKVAQFASMRESSYGNHWNGGSTYNFTGVVGKGAFATVYRVQTKMEGEVYAAKELDKRRFIKNGILDIKFDSELKIMRDLKHPNIVDYIDCQTHGHWIYIIMEYIPFGELANELRARDYLPESDVQQITRQTLHALEYLHNRNITHRDIKPDNILIASRDPLLVKLSDFGLSKCVTDQQTFLKTFCGTLLYCAPEVYPDYPTYVQSGNPKRRRAGDPAPRGSPYDQSVDMWSFGAVIFHLLCGKAPITGRGEDRGAQMLNNIMTKDIDFSPLRQRNISSNAIHFVSQLLNRNPFLRPKEKECFTHPWLRDVPDVCTYEVDDFEPISTERGLQAVDEVDEDIIDEGLVENLNHLIQAHGQAPQASDASPARPVKRPRTSPGPNTLSEAISYPVLPQADDVTTAPPPVLGGRLFGEITESVLRSSGIFGNNPPTTHVDVPGIRRGVADISVNDFGEASGYPTDIPSEMGVQQLYRPGEYLQAPTLLRRDAGAAPSLLGAEDQIEQLNMASPDAEISDVVSPETTNPITPRTRELSPSSCFTRSAEQENSASETNDTTQFARKIDIDLLSDEAAFAADVEARNASRAEKLRMKAETFHGPIRTQRASSAELAKTIDAKTGLEVQSAAELNRAITISQPSSTGTSKDKPTTGFLKPPRRLGKLASMPGSFANITINLESRLTSWGRGVDCTVPYGDKADTRIPKYALKLTFWAPGAEAHVENGGDWTQLPGIRTIISTSATGCIYVNDIELRKESEDGEAALFGKIYTGDIITIYKNPRESEYLKFRVEIVFGDSARPRPPTEEGFVVQKEVRHHQRVMKERESMRLSHSENDAGLKATHAAISAF